VAIACALLAAAGTGLLLGAARDDDRRATRASAIAFAGVAALLGIAPLVTGSLRHLTLPHAYYAFAAAPWLALLLGAALAQSACARGHRGRGRARGLERARARLSGARSRRAVELAVPPLGLARGRAHLRRVRAADGRGAQILASRPESLVVLYRGLAVGSFFQTRTAPRRARRCAIRRCARTGSTIRPTDCSAAATRARIRHRRAAPLALALADDSLATFAATGIALGRAARGWAFANYRDPMASPALGSRFTLSYLRACAALVGEGVAGFQRELAVPGCSTRRAHSRPASPTA
jgi:hypothetical protein